VITITLVGNLMDVLFSIVVASMWAARPIVDVMFVFSIGMFVKVIACFLSIN
jgi:hypothetical protein